MRTEPNFDRFPSVKRGYDPEIVESHLTTLIDENDRTLDEAAAQIASLQTDLAESRKHEEAIHLTILAATKAKEDMLAVAQAQSDQALDIARKQGDAIITDARMQAFGVVTEARQEADDIVAEARTEAGALLRTVEESEPTSGLPSSRETELEVRVEELQRVIAAMESELRSRPVVSESDARTDSKPEPVAVEQPTIEAAVVPMGVDSASVSEDDNGDDSPAAHVDAVVAEDIEIVMTDTARIVPIHDTVANDDLKDTEDPETSLDPDSPADTGRITDEREADSVRRSFYSRRSAKLPRIGAEAGRGAMAAAAGLRTGIASDESKVESDPDRSQEYETV